MNSLLRAARLAPIVLLLACLPACEQLALPPNALHDRFDEIATRFVDGHCAARPLEAVGLGWHLYDGRFVVPTREQLRLDSARLRQADAALAALDPDRLDASRRQDWRVLRATIAAQRWVLESARSYQRNPMTYASALDVSIYLKRDFKPLPERVRDMAAILDQAPALFAAARSNLDARLPLPFVQTAIEISVATAEFISKDLAAAAAPVTDPAIQRAFARASTEAARALTEFAGWLRRERLPVADAPFAVGRAAYVRMLRAELVELSPEEILRIGERELRAEQARFAAAAALIDPTRPPEQVYKTIQREHPTAEGLLDDTRRNLESIRKFVLDQDIVTIPSEVRAQVAATLPPFRATSFASMDTPGPFEKHATEAFYYITPVEPHWTNEQAEEWLTAFNYYTTDIVSIHETYPGHYLQFLALNASKASRVSRIFGSYAFIEGWAHYTEQLMIERGFGRGTAPAGSSTPDATLTAAKYRLAQSGEALLRLCRLSCSIRLHTQNMTVDQATQFFQQNAYYEEKPSRAEAIRGTYDPGYLYYSLGKLMILKLRADAQALNPGTFSLRQFHDDLLRHGAPPIPLLRERLLPHPARSRQPL